MQGWKGSSLPTAILQGRWPHSGFSRRHTWPGFCSEASPGDLGLPFSGWAQETFLHHPFLSTKGALLCAGHGCPSSPFVSSFGPSECSLAERTGGSKRRHCGEWPAAREVGAHWVRRGLRICVLPLSWLRAGWLHMPSQPAGRCVSVSTDKAPRFSAVVNSVFHTESLIVESLCLFPPLSALTAATL